MQKVQNIIKYLGKVFKGVFMKLENFKKDVLQTSKCCRKFVLPYPIEVIKENYINWLKQENSAKQICEIWLIYPMLIASNEKIQKYENDNTIFYYVYSCKHLNKKGECTIYDLRPEMCRAYPYGEPDCSYKKCITKKRCNAFNDKCANYNNTQKSEA